MDPKWTQAVADSKGPAPDMTPVEINRQFTIPREAITITGYMLGTMLGLKKPTNPPRWDFKTITVVINYLFPNSPDLTEKNLELVVGFTHQPSEMPKLANAMKLLDDKLVKRLEDAAFQASVALAKK